MIQIIKTLVSLGPVLLFLAGLVALDSFKLVRLKAVLQAIFIGCAVALLCMLINERLIGLLSLKFIHYSRYVAPVIEECLKAAFVVYLIRAGRVGFMVDAAIYGFAVGTGFALLENIYYLQTLESSNILLWIVRGFGTAAAHGSTTAVFGIMSLSLSERHPDTKLNWYLPGLAMAIIIHSLFNHFILPPVTSTIILLVTLSLLIFIVYERSERATRSWLGVGFDADAELMETITDGKIPDSNIGTYLDALRSRFPGEVVADMLCMLRLHTELAMRAKGILMMREAGIKIPPDPEIKEKLSELQYLEKSIGKTGKLAMSPFLKTSTRDLWQLYQVNE